MGALEPEEDQGQEALTLPSAEMEKKTEAPTPSDRLQSYLDQNAKLIAVLRAKVEAKKKENGRGSLRT